MTNESNQLLVIKAGQLIDGKSKNVKKDISIVINDNQIVDVKPSGELDIPENLNYKLSFHELDLEGLPKNSNDAIVEINQRFTKALEETVREYPEQYFWFHRRWKTKQG